MFEKLGKEQKGKERHLHNIFSHGAFKKKKEKSRIR